MQNTINYHQHTFWVILYALRINSLRVCVCFFPLHSFAFYLPIFCLVYKKTWSFQELFHSNGSLQIEFKRNCHIVHIWFVFFFFRLFLLKNLWIRMLNNDTDRVSVWNDCRISGEIAPKHFNYTINLIWIDWCSLKGIFFQLPKAIYIWMCYSM